MRPPGRSDRSWRGLYEGFWALVTGKGSPHCSPPRHLHPWSAPHLLSAPQPGPCEEPHCGKALSTELQASGGRAGLPVSAGVLCAGGRRGALDR